MFHNWNTIIMMKPLRGNRYRRLMTAGCDYSECFTLLKDYDIGDNIWFMQQRTSDYRILMITPFHKNPQ